MLLVGLFFFSYFIDGYYEQFYANFTELTETHFLESVKSIEPCEPFEPLTLNNSFHSSRISERSHLSEILQVASVHVLETFLCEQLLRPYHNRNWQGFQNHQICAGKLAGGVDTCQGDSGDPIQIEMPLEYSEAKMYWIFGVTSFGIINCGLMNRPGIYTRVASFIKWIEEIVWEPIE